MADKCTASDTRKIGGVMQLNKEDVLNIYKLAL
jgi:alcohol dehydrogenase YqhD (iron-dependent ADH family)